MKKGLNTNRKRAIVSLAFVWLMLPLWAQAQVLLTGKIKSKEAPIAWANVVLTNQAGKMVAGGLSKEDGSFELKAVQGDYRLTVSFLGFTTWEREIWLARDTTMGTIVLQQSAGELSAVTVVSKKKLIEYRPDRLVFNVENSVAAVGGNALQALTAAPGLLVQQNNISMLGKGAARVMIDGRLVELAGQELVQFLSSIAASDIQRIEVIANPPAKYEASGDGGLINIILKKGARNAWRNTTTVAYDQNTYAAGSVSNSFLYNKHQWKLSLSGNGKIGDSKVYQGLTTHYPQGPWVLSYDGRQKEDKFGGRMTVDYDLTPRTSIGVHYLLNGANPDSRDLVHINIFDGAGHIDSFIVNKGQRKEQTHSHTFNAHLVSQLDSAGRKVAVDIDYFRYNASLGNHFAADVFSPAGQFKYTDQAASNLSNQHIDNGSVRVDLEHPLKFLSLSYGAKLSTTRSRGNIQYFNRITGTPELDPKRSDEFVYREHNQAIYINGTKEISKEWNVQAGLRLENTQTTGYSKTLDQQTKNNYLKLFPTVYLAWQPSQHQQWVLNYGRRINRPGFSLLNPFRSYINSTSYSEGNPFLQPSFNDNFDLTHVYKGVLRTNLFFNITTGGFGPVFTSNPQTNTLVISRENYFKEYYYGIGETYTVNMASWWQSQNTLYLLASKSRFASRIKAVPVNTLQLYGSTNNTISLSKTTKLQVDFMYSSPFKRGLYALGYMSHLNIALKQSLLNNKLQLSMLCNDVFNTAYLKDYTSVVNGIKQVYQENNSSRFFRLSLTYQFGNNKINVKQRSFGNEEESKRADR